MNVPDDRRYSKQHEWIAVNDHVATIGITAYAQEQLGDVVFLELPEVGDEFRAGESFGVVESVKAASDVYTPVSGEVIERNDSLVDQPELVNQDCYGEAWMMKIRFDSEDELQQLLDHDAYSAHVAQVAT